jgi:CubicO group peptidase (beta-lactamase class C family)
VFAVSPAGFHLVARTVEAVTGRPFAEVAAIRVLEPAGMTATRFVAGDPEPFEGSDLETSAADLARFMGLVLARGDLGGQPVVSAAALAEAERDHTARLDTRLEPWVRWTGVPTFGLGVWRDRLRGDGTAAVVSAPGRFGTYPWIDRPRNAHGVLVVVDRTDPAQAVGASAALVPLVGPAIDTEGRPLRRPGTPVPAQD